MRASGYFFLTCPSCAASTSATQASFTLGWEAMPSSVENAMFPEPKAARRTVLDGGFDSISRTKNGAAAAVCKNDRRGIIRLILTQRGADGFRDLRGGGLASQVGGEFAGRGDAFHGGHQALRGRGLAQMLQHQRGGPETADGIGDSLPHDV